MMRIKRKKLTKDKLIRVKPIRIPYKAFLIIKTSKNFGYVVNIRCVRLKI